MTGFTCETASSLIYSGIESFKADKAGNLTKFGKSSYFKAVITGGLNGGISSSIAGGNFWMGVRQGIITSGLNHLAHDAYSKIKISNFNKSLKQEIIDADINPEDTPEFSKKPIVELLMKVKTLQDLWIMSGYQPFSLMKSLGIDPKSGSEILGETASNITATHDNKGKIIPGSFKVNGIKSLTLSRSTFSSYYQLGTTIGHELIHCIHIINGNFQNWLNLYGLDKAKKQAEIYAHKWNISVGDESSRKKIKLYQ